MTASDLLLSRLKREEGDKLYPYDDATGISVKAPKGRITWGRGFNLEACGSPGLFDAMERYLVGDIERQVSVYPWYQTLDSVRQSVVLDIAYNAGVHGLLHFPNMIAALSVGNWTAAAAECKVADASLDASRYAPLRALILAGGIA